jgi:hypothetical protein
MFKNLCLSAIIPVLFFASISASLDRITVIKENLSRITEIEKEYDTNTKKPFVPIWNKYIQYLQNILGKNYTTIENQVLSLLNIVFESNEFIVTSNSVADANIDLLINKHMSIEEFVNFDRTEEYNTNIANYPIIDKLNTILDEAKPALNEQASQLFMILFQKNLVIKITALFYKKLIIKKNELLNELASSESSN